MREQTTAAIIAGGRARRFSGQDKSRLVVEGRTIIVRQVEILQRVAAHLVVIGGPPDRFADLGLTVRADLLPDHGVLGGIYTALANSGTESVITVGADMPFLEAPLLERLVALAQGRDGAWVASAAGPEPLVACYQRAAAATVRRELDAGHLAANRLGAVLDLAEVGADELERFGDPARILANVNTPADYARVQYGPS